MTVIEASEVATPAASRAQCFPETDRETQEAVPVPLVGDHAGTVEGDALVSALPRGGRTILLVEDDDDVRDLAREILEDRGYVVRVAAHPLEALSIASGHQEPLHLLVTDVVMPWMGGRQLAEKLVRVHPETKVLYVSGYRHETLGHHGVLEPGQALLAKPFTPDGLARKVREVLDESPLERPCDAEMRHELGVTGPDPDARRDASRGARMSGGRILVVDDEVELRQLLSEFLLEKGYEVAAAESGAEALAAVESFAPQVVLLDVAMPGMDGTDVLERIVSVRPSLPVIMVTANADVGVTARVLALGAADYVPKPFNLACLDQAIRIQLAASLDQ